MENVLFHEHPSLEKPTLIAAMAGWPDAQAGATGALKYLIRKLSANRFAELDPEEFYIFTRRRPTVQLDSQDQRILRWPTNTFYYAHQEAEPQEFVFFVGIEPQLRWKTFTAAFMEVVRQCKTQRLIFLGSLLDASPHTREPRISGSATHPQLQAVLEEIGVRKSRYQGPTGAPTVLLEACRKEPIESASLWAHSPHYLQGSPNPQASYTLLKRLTALVGLNINLTELADSAAAFESQVNRAAASNQEMGTYIQRLEEQFDKATESPLLKPQEELPSSEVVIKELEEFLRGLQPQPEDESDEPKEPGLSLDP